MLLASVAALTAACAALAGAPAGAEEIEVAPGDLVPIFALEADAFTLVPAPEAAAPAAGEGFIAQNASAATIVVNYNGFSGEAQTAFQYAVDIWESYLNSDVTIEVDANWIALSPGVLGSAGATSLYANFSGAPQGNTWYPVAIANGIAGSDLNGGTAELVANFNSTYSNWYFGTDGNTPSGKYDFVSVVLHEIGHGLGFFGSLRVSNGSGSWGSGSSYPYIYDRYVENGSGQLLIDTGIFPNPSTALASQLQGNNLYFDGPSVVAAGGPARIYAPSTWQSGSSLSHLNESTYTAGHPDSLMTPAIGSAEAIHAPGPLTLGLLEDMGWELSGGGGGGSPDHLEFLQSPGGGTAGVAFSTQPQIAVRDSGGATVTSDNSTVITLTLNGAGGAVSCSSGNSRTVQSGVATFSGCSVSAAGSGFSLTANSSPSYTSDTSASFSIGSAPGTEWYFAEGFTGAGWSTIVHVTNPNPSPASITVTYLLDGASPIVRNAVVSAEASLSLDAADPGEGPGPDVAFGITLTSDIPVTAEQEMYAGASGDFAHATQATDQLSSTWYFAEGFTQFGWETFVLVANPGGSSADVTVTYQVQGGSPVERNVSVGAQQRTTFVGHADAPDAAFSVTVTSSQPVVAEMVMYDPGRTLAHRTIGVTGPSTEWHLGEGFTGFGWETFIAVGNPSGSDATVTATYNVDGGSPVAKQIVVPAGSRGTFIGHGTDSGVGAGEAFGVYITSNIPVIVQEVLIDPAPGAGRAHSTMASASLASQWAFSGGSSADGMATFLTVSNPGGSQVTVTATYYFEDGTTPYVDNIVVQAASRGTFVSTSGVPSGKQFGVVLDAGSGQVVAQQVVYDEPRIRAFSASGVPLP